MIKALRNAAIGFSMATVLVTGSAGFIGFHLSALLKERGYTVIGYDGMTEYYDVTLKQRRHQILNQSPNVQTYEAMLEDAPSLRSVFEQHKPDVVVHLAAQAGVRYSLENPGAYISANIVGTFNVMELAREFEVGHLLAASTSSVYGANEDMPFFEVDQTETPLTLYAATKKANESMMHSYAHLWKMPITMFRFFTVYGAWGRPDMALFKFVRNTIEGKPIDIYNNGEMVRDFTYVSDLVEAIARLIEAKPEEGKPVDPALAKDSLSPVAPFRVVNIGNAQPVKLMDFIEQMEAKLGKKAIRNMMGMQKGDVKQTFANSDLLAALTGFRPNTSTQEGISRFVDWYRDYYQV